MKEMTVEVKPSCLLHPLNKTNQTTHNNLAEYYVNVAASCKD